MMCTNGLNAYDDGDDDGNACRMQAKHSLVNLLIACTHANNDDDDVVNDNDGDDGGNDDDDDDDDGDGNIILSAK
uniref:Uncharacterized protein n=1 Tax=Glossina morsitans morsitans TaxID=37546 RepID=A0A1B0G1G0_GLOMM